jgi:predicted XRE-type DNA-binding protein
LDCKENNNRLEVKKMKKANSEIRQAIHDSGLYYWQVASEYGLNDGNFSRLLRKELSKGQKEEIITIINKLNN